jgi:hypothetical protein
LLKYDEAQPKDIADTQSLADDENRQPKEGVAYLLIP